MQRIHRCKREKIHRLDTCNPTVSMKRKERIFIIATFFSLFLFLAITAQVEPAKAIPAEISVEPSYQRVPVGENFTINVTVDPKGNEVMGVEYKLYFNNSLLNATLQTKGPFLSQDGVPTSVIKNETDNAIGRVWYGEYRQFVDYGVINPGILASISFKAIKPGTSSLNLTDIILSDLVAKPIPTLIRDGSVEVVQSTPSPLLVSGYVFYDNGSKCLNPMVSITNLNFSKEWNAKVNESSNYYQCLLTYPFEVLDGDILQFDAQSSDKIYLNSSSLTLTREEIEKGLLFFNLSLQKRTIRDVSVSTDYYPGGNGIKIVNEDDDEVTPDEMAIGEKYYILYEVVNDGEQDELVDVTVKVSNDTWSSPIPPSHEWFIFSGYSREAPHPPISASNCWNTSGLSPGYYTISAKASIPEDHNPDFYPENNERIREIPLEVSPIYKPDLVITEAWVCWPDNCTICYNITNIGEGTASAGHKTTLYIEGAEQAYDEVPVDLVANESYIGCFSNYTWTYTPPRDDIMVCADHDDLVEESDEDNNCLPHTIIWKCGDVDGSGYVTGYDAYLVHIRNIKYEWAADVDCSGYVTGYDAYLVHIRNLNCCCGA